MPQSASVVQPHAPGAFMSGGMRQRGPNALGMHSVSVWQPQIICDGAAEQCGPLGLVAHSMSPEHWQESVTQCGPNVLFVQPALSRHGTQM
jgi:hypothetical protein